MTVECEGVGGEGSRTMPRFLVSASRRMGFHYLGKAEGEAGSDRSGIQFFMCYL